MSTSSEHAYPDSIASPSDESYSKPRNAFAGRRKKIRDNQNMLANDTIVTEGGWQCRVERIERRIDSAGRSHYYPEEDLADGSDGYFEANLTSSQTPQHPNKGGMQDDKVQDDKVQKDARRSIILYYNYVTKKRGGLVEPGAYIKIKSPLILKFLRENAKFDEEVRPPRALCLPEFDYLGSRSADPGGSHWKPTRPPFMNLIRFYGINTTH